MPFAGADNLTLALTNENRRTMRCCIHSTCWDISFRSLTHQIHPINKRTLKIQYYSFIITVPRKRADDWLMCVVCLCMYPIQNLLGIFIHLNHVDTMWYAHLGSSLFLLFDSLFSIFVSDEATTKARQNQDKSENKRKRLARSVA